MRDAHRSDAGQHVCTRHAVAGGERFAQLGHRAVGIAAAGRRPPAAAASAVRTEGSGGWGFSFAASA